MININFYGLAIIASKQYAQNGWHTRKKTRNVLIFKFYINVSIICILPCDNYIVYKVIVDVAIGRTYFHSKKMSHRPIEFRALCSRYMLKLINSLVHMNQIFSEALV